MYTLSLRSWLLGLRPEPDEHKLHPWGTILGSLNALMFFLALMVIGGGIDIDSYYPVEALQMLKPLNASIFLPLIGTWPVLALLAVRGHFKRRLGYYICTALIVAHTLASMTVVLPQLYTYAYITQHF